MAPTKYSERRYSTRETKHKTFTFVRNWKNIAPETTPNVHETGKIQKNGQAIISPLTQVLNDSNLSTSDIVNQSPVPVIISHVAQSEHLQEDDDVDNTDEEEENDDGDDDDDPPHMDDVRSPGKKTKTISPKIVLSQRKKTKTNSDKNLSETHSPLKESHSVQKSNKKSTKKQISKMADNDCDISMTTHKKNSVMLKDKSSIVSTNARELTKPSGNTRELTKPSGNTRVLTKPSGNTRELTKPSGNTREFTKPSGNTRELTKLSGNTRELTEPSGNTRELTKPFGNTRELTKPSGNTRELREPSANTRELKKPSGNTRELKKPSGNTRELKKLSGNTRELKKPSARHEKVVAGASSLWKPKRELGARKNIHLNEISNNTDSPIGLVTNTPLVRVRNPSVTKTTVHLKQQKASKVDEVHPTNASLQDDGDSVRHGSDVLDLDVILECIEETEEEVSDQANSQMCVKAVKKVFDVTRKELRKTISQVHQIKLNQALLVKKQGTVKRLRRDLQEIQQRKTRFKSKVLDLKKRYNVDKDLIRINNWMFDFSKFQKLWLNSPASKEKQILEDVEAL